MRVFLMSFLAMALGCDDDDAIATPTEPALAALQHERCLPSELSGARVADAPRLSDETEGRTEIEATYTDGDGLARVMAVLYRQAAEIADERASEAHLLGECGENATCEERHVAGERARVISFAEIGQESTNLFFEPGVRVSVVASPGRSSRFAELVDLDCLRALHAARANP